MKRSLPVFLFLILSILMTGCSGEGGSDSPNHRKSPIAIAQVKHNGAYAKVVYGQPYKRDRTIFGNLVPYGEVWRTGANEATEITTTEDIYFGGKELKKGTYALFTIPHEEEWTIILNSELGQWGAFEYDSNYDVLRVNVPAQKTDAVTEAFTITFADVEDDSTSLNLAWNQTEVSIPIEFTGSPSS